MSELYANRKHLPDLLAGFFFCLVIWAIGFTFGHWKGMTSVMSEVTSIKAQAVDLGYAKVVKGELVYKSRRAIERGE